MDPEQGEGQLFTDTCECSNYTSLTLAMDGCPFGPPGAQVDSR